MKKALTITVILFLVLIFGIFVGRQSRQCCPAEVLPPGVIDARLMNSTWDRWVEEIKSMMLDDPLYDPIEDPGLFGDKKSSEIVFEDLYGDFEPMVFCHPFIILKRKDKSGHKVFINNDTNNPIFDNMDVPTLDYRQEKDSMGFILNQYIFRTPHRKKNGIGLLFPSPTVFEAYVKTAQNIIKSLLLSLS